MKRVKIFLKKLFPWLPYFVKRIRGIEITENVYNTNFSRNALMLYLPHPFYSKTLDESHQNYWQILEIAKKLEEKQYNVDVIDYEDVYVRLKKKYDLVVDIIPRENQVYLRNLSENATKIAYLTVSNPSYANRAEMERIRGVQHRRNVTLQPRRAWPVFSKEIETFDAVFMIGNSHTFKTYTDEFAMPPVYYIRNNGFCFDFGTDYTKKDPRKFLFFASSGQVHKGLDLLLEVFAQKDFPCELYVCSLFQSETDFEKCYWKELHETPNIHALGFIDIRGDVFRNLAQTCAYTIMPSCAEGLAGSTLTAMSAGMIPICSRACGFEEDEVLHLQDCSLDTIAKTVLECSEKDHPWIVEKSEHARQIVAQRYSQQNFLDSMHYAFDQVLK